MAMLAFIAALATVIVVGRTPTDQNATIGSFVASSSCQPLRLAYPTATPSDPAQNFGELYLPPPGRHARSGLVVLVHGGGWQSRLGGLHGLSPLARDLADEGLAVYNIEYRRVGSGGGWPTTLLDARDAATYAAELQSHNPQLQGPLIIVGHSAGGHLACMGCSAPTIRACALGSFGRRSARSGICSDTGRSQHRQAHRRLPSGSADEIRTGRP